MVGRRLREARQHWCFVLDLLCCAVIGFATLALYIGPVDKNPSFRGFNCDDDSINKPYRANDKVPTILATFVGLGVGIATIFICEVVSHFVFRRDVQLNQDGRYSLWPFQFCVCPPWFRRLFIRVFIFLAGTVITNLFTQMGKLTIGRLRPHFLSVCKPDYSRFNCSDGYIVADVCTGNPKLIMEARKSFPSGHSSFSAYFMVFLVVYIEAMIPTRRTVFFKPFLQIVFLTMGVLCSLSRVYDYRHHWSDVLVGMLLGTIVALFVTFRMLQLFKRRDTSRLRYEENEEPNPHSVISHVNHNDAGVV